MERGNKECVHTVDGVWMNHVQKFYTSFVPVVGRIFVKSCLETRLDYATYTLLQPARIA